MDSAEAEERLYQHRIDLIKDEHRYRVELILNQRAVVTEVSITIAILIEVIVNLLEPLLSTRDRVLLGSGVAILACCFIIYIRASSRAALDGQWHTYQRKLNEEMERHERLLRGW